MPASRILPGSERFRKTPKLVRRESSSRSAPDALPELAIYYDALFRAHGPQNWWPGRTRFEVIVGAILTQNTSWRNVERAIGALRREKLLTVAGIEKVETARLAELIRSSGYFRQKARKLKEFVRFLRERYEGSLNKMFAAPTERLREELLAVHGIGPETADSILLYAGGHRVFVVDAYTRRILERHGLVDGRATYEEIRALFERSLPEDVKVYNEYHALIVQTGKTFCRKKEAECGKCALGGFLGEGEEKDNAERGRGREGEIHRAKVARWRRVPRREDSARNDVSGGGGEKAIPQGLKPGLLGSGYVGAKALTPDGEGQA
jgi:endonuclease III related protein